MRLPSIAGGRRSVLLARLIVYGLASAGLGLLLAGRIRHAFHAEAAPGSIGELAFSLLGLTILLFGLQVLEARDAEGLGQDYVVRVRQRLLASLARRTWSQADATGHGATMSRLIGDLNSLRNWVSLGVARMLSSGVALCGLILVLAQFRLRVAWMMFVVIGLILLAWKAMTPILRRSVREGRRLRGSLANRVWDQISHGPTRRLLGNGNLGLDRLLRLGKQMRRVLVRRATFSAILRRSPELAHGLALAGLLFLLSPSGASHAEDPGGFAAALFVIGMIIARLRDMARAWDYRVAYDEGTRRISRLLGEPTVEISKTAQPLPGEGPVALSLNGVGWSETGGGWTASAQAGERVLVIGESGSGKIDACAVAGASRGPCYRGDPSGWNPAPGDCRLAPSRAVGFGGVAAGPWYCSSKPPWANRLQRHPA
jgi:ABC-type multidrug transport system fused ATPase/permease subunit